ncbi:CaiB/BaiF CoA transferase family protein [Rhizobium sp. C4]|uniref:CaiB/BaiF CoA transferase family protein n=1 Tax=Rhizobium sp. C4 TaxID=1349800 RepID=UPI001E5FBE2A|nr:CoA transferase [Rhizobium sp. C4]MCD2172230.1 CoA transferase [Rhizobium sp. C4]
MVGTGALQGLRVIDFGQYIAGPLAAMQLADHGADVIRVEPPGGPFMKGPGNAMWNRGKRSIVLDLKQVADLHIARRLIAGADVVIENFRPGVMTRLGLDPHQLTRLHPHLVWCSLPGFASSDARAAMPGWEGMLGAATGNFLLKAQRLRTDGGRRELPADDGRPIYTMTPVSSVYAGCMGALSIAMALVARQRDGRGQHIEVPLHDATFMAIGSPKWKGLPGTPWVRSYQCADGRWVDMLCYHGKHVRAFLKGAGVEDWLGQPFMNDINKVFRTDPVKVRELLSRMEALFAARPAVEWEETLNRAGVPIAMVRTSQEWMELQEARESGCIVEINDPELGPMLQPGIQARLSETPGAITRPAPFPDQHRDEILSELETRPPLSLPLATEPDNRPPLAGLRLVDLGSVLVGPACGRTLAEFGADVIKIDDPNGVGAGPDVNRGKRSMFLDLKKPGTQPVLEALAGNCDLFLQNFRLGVADKMGISFDKLRELNPHVIYISYSLYGLDGPWAWRPGYENQAQAATGMMERFGDGVPAMEPFPVNDYGTALTGSFGVALAVYHRNSLRAEGKTAPAQQVSTGLVFTASLLQSIVMNTYDGKSWSEPRGQESLGSSPLHRCYKASDGWMFVAARPEKLPALKHIEGLEGVSALEAGALETCLEDRLQHATVDEWSARLLPHQIGVHRVQTVQQVMADPSAAMRGIYLDRPHPDGGRSITIGPIPNMSRTPLVPGQPLRPSMEGPDILSELGIKPEPLLESKAVVVVPPLQSEP